MVEMDKEKIDVNFLAHVGVPGMKWGERRYQNKDGSLTEEGRRHWGVGPPRKRRKSFRLETKAEAEERKQINLEKRADAIAKKKVKLIGKGDREAIYKNRNLFTDEELQYALKRIELTEKFGKPKEKYQIAKDLEKIKSDPLKAAENARKEALMADGDIKKIYENRKLFTNDELKEAIVRADYLSKLDPKKKEELVKNEKTSKDGKDKTQKLIDSIGNATKVVSGVAGLAIAGYTGYNQIAAIMNTVGNADSREKVGESILEWASKDEKNRGRIADTLIDFVVGKGDNKKDTNIPFWSMDVKKIFNSGLSEKDFRKILKDMDVNKDEIEELVDKAGF